VTSGRARADRAGDSLPGDAPTDDSLPDDASPLDARSLELPHPSRLAPDDPRWKEIIDAHRAAMAEGEPGYLDPGTGLFVLTAATLADRKQCCGSGCRHCPYVT
jgi:hypothetical protein